MTGLKEHRSQPNMLEHAVKLMGMASTAVIADLLLTRLTATKILAGFAHRTR
ncbi:MAG: hypothetical protein ACR2PW_05355 [Gammaproteobacteria bacterium]